MQSLLSRRKYCLTIRSSREWNVMIAILPPGLSTCVALGKAVSRFSNSLFTAILNAWNVRVAGWRLGCVSHSPALCGVSKPRDEQFGSVAWSSDRPGQDDRLVIGYVKVLHHTEIRRASLLTILVQDVAARVGSWIKRLSIVRLCRKKNLDPDAPSCIVERPKSSTIPSTDCQSMRLICLSWCMKPGQ
jgi:hypothetical protein